MSAYRVSFRIDRIIKNLTFIINPHPVHPLILDILIQATKIINHKPFPKTHQPNHNQTSCKSLNPGYPDLDKNIIVVIV
ncbi:MAG: hypothetical protein AN482_11490 [Anabaena sp. LE011-02]|nr:MAG: hypothetical protein AN482_11490 [Anabaena sp. LE011-02]